MGEQREESRSRLRLSVEDRRGRLCRSVGIPVASGPILILLLASGHAVDPAEILAAENGDRVAPVVELAAESFRSGGRASLDGPFKHAMELDRKYLLSLDADRLLHVFRLNAGRALVRQAVWRLDGPRATIRAANSSGIICRPAPNVCRHGGRAAQGKREPGGGRSGGVPGDISATDTSIRIPTRSAVAAKRPSRSGTRSTRFWPVCSTCTFTAATTRPWRWPGSSATGPGRRPASSPTPGSSPCSNRARRHQRGICQPLRAHRRGAVPQAQPAFQPPGGPRSGDERRGHAGWPARQHSDPQVHRRRPPVRVDGRRPGSRQPPCSSGKRSSGSVPT